MRSAGAVNFFLQVELRRLNSNILSQKSSWAASTRTIFAKSRVEPAQLETFSHEIRAEPARLEILVPKIKLDWGNGSNPGMYDYFVQKIFVGMRNDQIHKVKALQLKS